MGRETEQFEQLLELLPEGWEEKAKELGAFERGREIKTPRELLRLILLYITEGKSFARTSAIINLSQTADISKIAVFKRIQKCGNWLKWLCRHIYRKAGLIGEKPQWLENKNVILIDGSQEGKRTEGKQYQYHMLHYSMELFTLCVREFLISDIKEAGEKLSNFNCLGEDDIVMADRVYTTLTGLSDLKERGCGYVLRLQADRFKLYDKEKQRIDLLECFSSLLEGETADMNAYCHINKQYEPLRICAMRKYKKDEDVGLQRIMKTNQRKHGRKMASPLQHEYNKYIILITSLGQDVPACEVLSLYRMRWQIELAFKRLKSIFHYNEMPARKPENIRTWFYGTMLLAALCEALVNTGRFPPCTEPGW